MEDATTGVDPQWIAGNDFIMLHLDLIDALDGDFHAALLLERIRFRAGDGCWKATLEDMQDATRLSLHHIRRATRKLRDLGFVSAERMSSWDPTMCWSVVISEENAEIPVNKNHHITRISETTSRGEVTPLLEVRRDHITPSSKNSKEQTDKKVAEPRPDVDQLCDLLAEKITENGSRPPTVNQSWRDSARLMLDKDHIPFDDIRGCILWCQNDEFWRSNILSMPKLRQKYDQLRLQAMREHKPDRMQAHIAHIRDLWENEGVENPTRQLEG